MIKKKPSQKIWKTYKAHFTRALSKNQKRRGNLRKIRIANQVKDQVETNRNNTEAVAKFQIEQSQTIEELTRHLDHLEI